MNITRVVRNETRESIFAQIHNAEGAALSKGDVVELTVQSASPTHPGKSVELAAAASLLVFGVVKGKNRGDESDIPDEEFGVAQIYGFCDFILTDGTIAEGDLLIAGAGGVADQGALGTNDAAVFGVSLDADNASSELLFAFIKNM